MDCLLVRESFFEPDLPLFFRLRRSTHILFCAECEAEYRKASAAEVLMSRTFALMPPHDIGKRVMNALEIDFLRIKNEERKTVFEWADARIICWILAGLLLLLSFVFAFFGTDFSKIASSSGQSYLLPFGIMSGGIITAYLALFVGTHLDFFQGMLRGYTQ